MKIYKSIGIIAPSSPVPGGLIEQSITYCKEIFYAYVSCKQMAFSDRRARGSRSKKRTVIENE